MAPEPLPVAFTDDDVAGVLDQMARLEREGGGWINLDPLLDVEELPEPPSGLSSLFSAKGPPVPRATWIAPTRRRRTEDPATIGIEHGLGRRALPHLIDHDLHIGSGWRTLSDSAKRGMVIALPPRTDHREVLTWLLRAARLLSTVELTGRWRASVYDR